MRFTKQNIFCKSICFEGNRVRQDAGPTGTRQSLSLFMLHLIAAKSQTMQEKIMENGSGNFVICDEQKEYSECLYRALAEQLHDHYRFYLFHHVEEAENFLERADVDILLICEEYMERMEKGSRFGKCFILTHAPAERPGRDNMAYIYRYQSADAIIGTIRKVTERTVHRKKGGTRIRDDPVLRGLIGIYSPVHRIGKTRFALRMGKKMAEKIPVLYLNMEGNSGESHYFSGSGEQDLGDLLCYFRQERPDYGMKLSSITGQMADLDYIRPMKNELDLRSVKGSEWIRLLDMIFRECIYEAVILDLGECINGLYDILGKCDRIYMPYINDGISMAKIRQYEDNLRMTGNEKILRHTVKRLMMRKRIQTGESGGAG